MAITKKQKELDEIKWLKSIELGADACGTFDYCAKCNKSLENPCEKAYKKLHAKPKAAKPAATAKAEEKAPAKAPAKRTCKKK